MRKIKKATILGVNGTMGSGSAVILAGFGGIQVHALARTMEMEVSLLKWDYCDYEITVSTSEVL